MSESERSGSELGLARVVVNGYIMQVLGLGLGLVRVGVNGYISRC